MPRPAISRWGSAGEVTVLHGLINSRNNVANRKLYVATESGVPSPVAVLPNTAVRE